MAVIPYAVRQHDDFEPQYGLPQRLPEGESLLWQGSPLPGAVFRHVFHGAKLALYFALLLVWQMAALVHDGATAADALRAAARVAPLYAIALGLLAGLAWLSARTTVYTLTSRRVVMRIGIVLTVSYNLPLRRLAAAHLLRRAHGVGEIALELEANTRIAWLHLWPHARPWCLDHPQPMLRCLAGAEAVARTLLHAWREANLGRPLAAPSYSASSRPAAASAASAAAPVQPSACAPVDPAAGMPAPSAAAHRTGLPARAIAGFALAVPACIAAHLPGAKLGWPQA